MGVWAKVGVLPPGATPAHKRMGLSKQMSVRVRSTSTMGVSWISAPRRSRQKTAQRCSSAGQGRGRGGSGGVQGAAPLPCTPPLTSLVPEILRVLPHQRDAQVWGGEMGAEAGLSTLGQPRRTTQHPPEHPRPAECTHDGCWVCPPHPRVTPGWVHRRWVLHTRTPRWVHIWVNGC